MELTNHEKQMLHNTMMECVKDANCATLEKIFLTADWTWADPVLDNPYNPNDREIRNCIYRLAMDAKQSLIADYEAGKWNPQSPMPYTTMSGRLYFTIDWHSDNGNGARLIEDVHMECGIQTASATTEITEVTKDTYKVETYTDDEHDYYEVFDKIGE